jgi:hypothetical protein
LRIDDPAILRSHGFGTGYNFDAHKIAVEKRFHHNLRSGALLPLPLQFGTATTHE